MEKQDLNRDIKRLQKRHLDRKYSGNTSDWNSNQWRKYQVEQDEIKAEFLRLYRADTTFKAMNKTSVLILLTINRSLRIISLHTFGIDITF